MHFTRMSAPGMMSPSTDASGVAGLLDLDLVTLALLLINSGKRARILGEHFRADNGEFEGGMSSSQALEIPAIGASIPGRMAVIVPLSGPNRDREAPVQFQQTHRRPASGSESLHPIFSPAKVIRPTLPPGVEESDIPGGERVTRLSAGTLAQGTGHTGQSQIFQCRSAAFHHRMDVVHMECRFLTRLR
jgi:hypothetical protein